jgi:hypothetical protein
MNKFCKTVSLYSESSIYLKEIFMEYTKTIEYDILQFKFRKFEFNIYLRFIEKIKCK